MELAIRVFTFNLAELALRQEEQAPSYPLALLSITQSEQSSPVVRLASSLAFKNLVKRKWAVGCLSSSCQAVADLVCRTPMAITAFNRML